MWKYNLVLGVHVVIALMLIGLVLLQRGKGAEAGTGFGAGASGTVFGARGSANFLSRSTAVLATLFFVSCLTLVYLTTQTPTGPRSLIEADEQRQEAQNRSRSPGDASELPVIPEDVRDGNAAAPATGASTNAAPGAGAATTDGSNATAPGAPADDANR